MSPPRIPNRHVYEHVHDIIIQDLSFRICLSAVMS